MTAIPNMHANPNFGKQTRFLASKRHSDHSDLPHITCNVSVPCCTDRQLFLTPLYTAYNELVH